MLKNIASWVADCLAANGVDRVFVYPGGTIAPLVNACIEVGIVIENFKNEQGAGYAAIAYSRLTGRPQVIMVTSGPGVTNILTPLADAYYDSTPVIVITGQVGTADLESRLGVRQRGFQEVPTVDITSPISKFAICLKNSKDVFQNVPSAFKIACDGRHGPVVLDFPMDVQRSALDAGDDQQEFIAIPRLNHYSEGKYKVDEALLKGIAEAALKAKFPVILLGQGALISGDFASYVSIAERLDAGVVTSFLGVGAYDCDNHRSLGYIGHTGNFSANLAVHESDFLLVLGSRLDIRQTGSQVNDFVPNGRVAWVDVDLNELENPRVDIDWKVRSSISNFCNSLIEFLPDHPPASTNEMVSRFSAVKDERPDDTPCLSSSGMQPRDVMDAINLTIKGINTTVVTGVGCHQHWAARHLSFKPNQVKQLSSGGHGAMGYDLPSAVGAAMAEPERLVLCIVGDGSILMNIQELATIRERGLNIKIVVLNNSRLGMVSQFQLITWGADPTTGDIDTMDFKSIGDGFGISSFRFIDHDSMVASLREIFDTAGPSLIEVMIDPEADVVPMLLGGQKMNEMWMGRDK